MNDEQPVVKIPLPETFNFKRGDWEGYVNRARPIIETCVDMADEFIQMQHPVIQNFCHTAISKTSFTYFDPYRRADKPRFIEPTPKRDIAVRVLPRSAVTNGLADKKTLAQMIAKHNLSDIAPVTYLSMKSALAVGGDPDRLMFIKLRNGTRGENVWCTKYADLGKEKIIEGQHIIQENISNPALFYNRKTMFRFYLFIYNKQIFLSKHGVVVVHGADYDPSVTDHKIHVQHNGQGLEAIRFPFFKLPYMDVWFDQIKDLSRKVLPILERVRKESSLHRYLVIGADGIPCTDDKVRLIEFNTFPSLIKPPMIEPVYAPMLSSVMLMTVTGLNDNTWVKLT